MKKALTQERLAEMLDITPIHLKNIEGSGDSHRRADGAGGGGTGPAGGRDESKGIAAACVDARAAAVHS